MKEVADFLGTPGADAFDEYLVTGGFPRILASRAEHADSKSFLGEATRDESHPLVFTGQQVLDAEFPPQVAARSVLEAVGSGEVSWSRVLARAGVSQRTLSSALDLLRHKGIVVGEDPLCAGPVLRRTRYRVADPYLRFWLRFLGPGRNDIARERGDLVLRRIREEWQEYAGAAVEPLVRDSVERLLPLDALGGARHVGSFWTRDNQFQVDLTGTAQERGNRRVEFVGSIKWRAKRPFGPADGAQLRADAGSAPGYDAATAHVGVSRNGFQRRSGVDFEMTPELLLEAWRTP